ncbi:MAG TPA: DNA polymerase III subunit beta [Haliangiales bacterium]|nr:DNA polymerase III subunit beta [Haliangiales bacterium]
MEFRIQKSEFLRGLRLAQGIADRRSTMPILANVLLRTDGKNKLLLAATDLNVSVSVELAAKIDKEGGLTVGARPLHDVVQSLPGEDVVFRRAENNWADIRAAKVAYKLVGMPDRDFPKMPDHREVKYSKVDPAVLREMIDKTLFSVSNDETRFHLNGVLLECDGARARMVSTDGHRLSKVERTLTGGPVLPQGVIIPRKGLTEMKRALEGAASPSEMAVAGIYVFVKTGEAALAVKIIEAQFPPYDKVIPTGNDKSLVVGRKELLEALRRASLMSSDTRGIKLAMEKGILHIASDNPELGEVREELEVEYAGEPLAIGFNPKYFEDILQQMTNEQVRLDLSGELDPGVIRPADGTDYLGVVMPMRI